MSTSQTSPPPVPGKRPYGAVRLPCPVPEPARPQEPARTSGRAPRGAGAAPGRWYGPEVTLPLLSWGALRDGTRERGA
ncbi:hypothetical protein ABZ832_30130 [Streptantibioticus parmotrematis]|uniref:hypothetical protein n=1 Tax=Streptantibioticus parmotrematis TaxID=2873249 RepID=UPI003404A6CB